jgi:hypothetical protein
MNENPVGVGVGVGAGGVGVGDVTDGVCVGAVGDELSHPTTAKEMVLITSTIRTCPTRLRLMMPSLFFVLSKNYWETGMVSQLYFRPNYTTQKDFLSKSQYQKVHNLCITIFPKNPFKTNTI